MAAMPGLGVMMFAGETMVATAEAVPLCERPATPAMIAVASAGGTEAMLIPSEGLSPLLHAAMRNGGAIDCDERLPGARRDPVNEARRDLLADAALSGDQQRAVDIGDAP